MNNTQEFCTTAYLCQIVQRSPNAVNRAAEVLGLTPTIINGLRHWDGAQIEKLIAHFREESKS